MCSLTNPRFLGVEFVARYICCALGQLSLADNKLLDNTGAGV